jgi:hypothetical protein
MTQPDQPSAELPKHFIDGLANHAAHIVFEANDADGSRISIVEVEGERCTVIVHEPGFFDAVALRSKSRNSSTVVLPLELVAEMTQALDQWLRGKRNVH